MKGFDAHGFQEPLVFDFLGGDDFEAAGETAVPIVAFDTKEGAAGLVHPDPGSGVGGVLAMGVEFQTMGGAGADGIGAEVFGSGPVEETEGEIFVSEAAVADGFFSGGGLNRGILVAPANEKFGFFLLETEDDCFLGVGKLVADFAIGERDGEGPLSGAGAEPGLESCFLGDVIKPGLAEDFVGVGIGSPAGGQGGKKESGEKKGDMPLHLDAETMNISGYGATDSLYDQWGLDRSVVGPNDGDHHELAGLVADFIGDSSGSFMAGGIPGMDDGGGGSPFHWIG